MDTAVIATMNETYTSRMYGTRSAKSQGDFSDAIKESKKPAYSAVATGKTDDGKPSSITESLKKHPDWKNDVDKQLNAGLKYLSDKWKDGDPTEDMTMDEYKEYMTDLICNLPRDVSQQRDVFALDITDEGWEQMKKDHDYEAWIVGHNIVNNSFHNPWASFPGYSPSYHTEHFGASIEEHIGQSWPMEAAKDKKDDKGFGLGDWWIERRERFEENLKTSLEESIKHKQLYGRQMQAYYQSRLLNRSMTGADKGARFNLMEFDGPGISVADIKLMAAEMASQSI